jgi:hypothetical protein
VREVMPVLREVGTEQEEAASTLGASSWQTFWRITLPSIRWGVGYGVVISTARVLGEFGAVTIVSGSILGGTQTLPLFVRDQFDNFNLAGAYAAALDRGAEVTVIAASTSVALPEDASVIHAETSQDLRSALIEMVSDSERGPGFDALVMAAAVADFAPAKPSSSKLTRGQGLTLDLVPTPDILAEVVRIVRGLATAPAPVLVGFAAETGSLERAEGKLREKGVDLLVANDVSEPGSGFDTDTNQVVILDRDGGREELPLLSKREVADRLLDRIARRLDDRHGLIDGDGLRISRAVDGRTTSAQTVWEEIPR